MPAPTGESAVLDFDNWLGGQDDYTRSGVQQILDVTPEPERDARKQRIAAVYAVSELSGIEPADVHEQWDTVRAGFAVENGWEDVKADDAAFIPRLREKLQHQRDERHLLLGPDELTEDPQAQTKFMMSLAQQAREAAYSGVPYANALADWQNIAKGKPGWKSEAAELHERVAREEHGRMKEALERVRPVAEQAFKTLQSRMQGKQPSMDEAQPSMVELFRGLTPEEKDLAFRVMGDKAGGDSKGFWQATGEALGRGFENLVLGGGTAALRSKLIDRRFKAGDRVTAPTAGEQVTADLMRESLARQSGGIGSGAAGLGNVNAGRPLTAEEADQWNQDLQTTLEDVDTAERLRKFGQEVIDPTNEDGSWVRRKLWLPVMDSAAIMANLAVPGAWAPAIEMGARSYQNEEYSRLRGQGMESDEANRLAAVSGAAQAGLDKLQLGVLARGVPGTRRVLQQFAMQGRRGMRFAANATSTLYAETAIELTQDHVIPALVQDNLATDPRFDVRWGDVWREAAAAAPDVALGMVLLSGFGGAAQSSAQTAAVRQLGGSRAAMRLRGYELEQIDEIQAAPEEMRGELLAKYLPTAAPEGAAKESLIQEYQVLAAEEQAAFAAKTRAETSAVQEAADYAVRVTRNAEGWQITKPDGKVVTVDTAEAARRIREDLRQVGSETEAAALVDIVDSWHAKAGEGTERETVLTGETVRAQGDTVTATKDGKVVERFLDPKNLQTLREEAQMDAQQSGNEEIDVLVNGSNSVEFAERVGTAARAVVQRLELNQSESVALTAIHEQIEANWRTGVARGTITREDTQRAIAGVSAAFDPSGARTPEERAFRERVRRVADGSASETELRETISELAVAEIIGRRKDGRSMPAGSVTAALDAAIQNATNAAEVAALGKFRAYLRAVRQWFRAVFGTVQALKKARKGGKAQDFDKLIDKLLGLDEQARQESDLADEVGEYVPPSEEEMAAGVAFRVSATSRLDLVMNRLDAALKRDPSKRRDLARQANVKLQDLAYRWETERWTPQGDVIRPVVEKRSAGELEKEAAVRQATRADELESAGMAGLASETLMAFERGLERLEDRPLIHAMLGNHGKLISKATAARRGLFGEYDGAPWLPPKWYAKVGEGGLLPDQMAQNLYDDGLLREPSPDALWAALGREVESVRGANEAFREAAKVVSEISQRSKSTAREESAAWLKEQQEMQRKDWSPRQRMVRDLRTLDAILSVMPPEVRAKVGGFVKLAMLGSDEARIKEIQRRITKLDRLLERHLQDETTEAMLELIEKARPDRQPGKQSRGKIGAEAHRFFDAVEAAMGLSTEQVDAQRAALEAAYAAPDLTLEQAADIFEQQQILDTFGAWDVKTKTAAEMDAALASAQSVYDTGRNERRMIEEQRLADVQGFAGQMVERLGAGGYAAIQKQKRKAKGLTKKASDLALDLKSFIEVLEMLLGADHPLVKRWGQAARDGFARRNDEIRDLRKRWREALEKATGKKGVKARRVLWDMGQVQTIEAPNIGKAAGDSQVVPIALIDQWKAGTAQPDALGITADEADILMADRDAMDPGDRRQSLPLARQIRQNAGPVSMTQAEGIFITMLGAQEQYSEALDAAGWDTASLEAIEAKLTPAAKQLRDFMREEYKTGYGPLAGIFERMYGVALPQIKNYAPASFYHVGAERERGPEERGGAASGMRAGFLANRKRHKAMPRNENAFATFFGHAAQTAHWKGLAEFVREFSGVIGRPEVKQAIEAAHGEHMLKTLSDWVRNLEGNGLQQQAGMLDKAVSLLASAQSYIALAYNVGTVLKQSSALLGAAYRMPLGAYASGMAKLLSGQLDARKMFQNPVIQRRLESGFAPEVRAALNDVWTAKPTRRAAVLEAGMQLIGFTDALFTTGSAAIAYDYHLRQAQAAGLTGAAAEGAAMREVEDMIGRTAQPADAVDRSLFEARLSPFGRLMFMFASEARQKSSLWLSAWQNTLTGKATRADLRTLFLLHFIVAPAMQAITAAWRDARNDDDEELFDEENWDPLDFLKAIVAGPLAGIPLVGEALSGFPDSGIFGRQAFAGKSLVQIWETLSEGEEQEPEWYVKRITRVMQGLDAFTGVAGKVIDHSFSVIKNAAGEEE